MERAHGRDETGDKVAVSGGHDLVDNEDDGNVRFVEEGEQVKTLHALHVLNPKQRNII